MTKFFTTKIDEQAKLFEENEILKKSIEKLERKNEKQKQAIQDSSKQFHTLLQRLSVDCMQDNEAELMVREATEKKKSSKKQKVDLIGEIDPKDFDKLEQKTI